MTAYTVRFRGISRDVVSWPRSRWSVFGAVTILALLGLGLSGVTPDPGTAPTLGATAPVPGWLLGLAALGAPLLGLLVASYRGAPIAATPTRCDLRWPAFSVTGLALAVQRPTSSAILGGLDAMGTATRLAVAFAAIVLLVWGTLGRLALERRATAAAAHGATALARCSTCRPLFPTRAAAAAPRARVAESRSGPPMQQPTKNGRTQ